MKTFLGLGGSLHDFAACLIDENNIIFAIEDERLIRKRYALNSPSPHVASVDYCLNHNKINLREVDSIIGDDMIDLRFFPDRELINHHIAHIYSVFFTSKFKESAILVLDGVGSLSNTGIQEERETTTYAFGNNNKVTILNKIYGTPSNFRFKESSPRIRINSIGEFYRLITEVIGFEFLEAGKTMGLHPYGDDRFVEAIIKFVELKSNGQYEINMEGDKGLISYLHDIIRKNNLDTDFKVKASLAFAGQKVTEKILDHCLSYLSESTKSKNLCLAGGVILNSVANGKISLQPRFENVHIISAPGDSGASIGAAIFGRISNTELSKDPIRLEYSPYLGVTYESEYIYTFLQANGIPYSIPANIHKEVAEMIANGLVVACFQGRSEFGPRALGNRSIFADPRKDNIKDQLNNIKGREWFRPVAPVVLEEDLNKYFKARCLSEYMQFVFDIRDEYIDKLKGCIHVDKSARVQSVSKQANPFLHSLLYEFGNITEYPILINTSFNIKGYPIVETPQDAINIFVDSKIDALVIDRFLLKK